jgi:hypothetical protein
MTLAYNLQWGAGIGIDLGVYDAALGVEYSYDAAAHGIIGFMFDIMQGPPGPPALPAPATLRVSLQMPGLEDASHFITVMLPSVGQRVMFPSPAKTVDEVEQGSWVMAPTQFTPQAIETIKFEVNPNNQAPKDYNLCVSNFRVLCAGECIP